MKLSPTEEDPHATLDISQLATKGEISATPEPPEPSQEESKPPKSRDEPAAPSELQGDGYETLENLLARSTHAIRTDLTLDLDGAPPVDADLAQRMTGQWGAAVTRGGDPRQTYRQSDVVLDDPGSVRSTLPIKSRSVRQRTDDQPAGAWPPADAPDYELLTRIGEGGMGVVYAAHQSSIARTVAVKMFKPGAKVTAGQRDKFISEAVVTGELDHPNIVPVHDLGANDEGALFYSMKRVNGTPWERVLHEKSLEENLNILIRVADAVAFAHASGVVHRDLKPENVMLGDFGEVLVMDWGLAWVTDEFRNANAVCQTENLGGTPAYMAPELARGPVEKIDARSDVYLLGSILYEIVTGRPPHRGDDVMQCLVAAAKNEITPPIQPPEESRAELLEISRRALSTERADRHPTVKDFQAALRDYLSHSESQTLSANAQQRLGEARQTNDYALYANALFGFQESLALWPENEQAQTLLKETQTAYASAALAKEDYDLGLSLLSADSPEHKELRADLSAARAERDARLRRLRNAKRLAAALVAVVIGVTTFAYLAVRQQRNAAIAARQEADRQRDRAEENALAARENEATAIVQRKAAEQAREAEALARQNAEEARLDEHEARLAEAQQREIAEQAKQSEQYESYLAKIGLASERIEENAFDAARSLLQQCQPESLRHWEWGRLAYLCELSPRSFACQGPIEAVAYSPDGSHVLTGDWSGQVVVRDLATGKTIFSVQHGEYVHSVAYSPDGARIATGSSDGHVRIVDAETGELLQTLPGHAGGVLGVAFSPSGNRLASGGYDNLVRLWDPASGDELASGKNHTWWVWSVEFSPSGAELASAGQDGRVLIWSLGPNAESLEQRTAFEGHQGPVYAATYSPDGGLIASAGYDGKVRLWSPDEVQPLKVADLLDGAAGDQSPNTALEGHERAVRCVCFSRDGRWLLSGGEDNSLRLWDARDGQAIKTLRGHGSRVMACAFSPSGRRAASGGHDQRLRLWDIEAYEEQRVLQGRVFRGHADAILAARFSSDGGRVVTASRDRTARLWDADSGDSLQSFREGHQFLASTAEAFDSGRRLATGAGDSSVRLWDVAAGTEYATLRPTGPSAALAVDPGGRWLVTSGPNNQAIIWSTDNGGKLTTLSGHQAPVTATAVAPDGALIATGDERGKILLWTKTEDSAWQSTKSLSGHSRLITSLAFAGSSRLLLSSSGDNTCGQWDTGAGSELRDRVLKHPDWVASIAVSPDGQWAVTCCDDGLARLWRLDTSRVAAQFASPGGVFTSVDMSSSGKQALLTSAADRKLWRWELSAALAGGDAPPAELLLGPDDLTGHIWASRWTTGGRLIAIGGNDARIWNPQLRRTEIRFSPHGAVASAALSASGKLLATGSWDHSVKIWRSDTGRATQKIEAAHAAPINSVVFAPGSDTEILTASDDGDSAVWNLAAPEGPVLRFQGHTGRVAQAAYSPSGDRVLTVASDKTGILWDRATGDKVLSLVGHRWGLLCGEFSPDGSRVVTGGEDNVAIVWDARSGARVTTLEGHTAAVTSVAFSPDGRRVLTGSKDGAAKLWDALSGKETLTLDGHLREVTSVDFSPNGLQAMTAGRDGVAILWRARPWIEPKPPAALNAAR